MKELNRTYDPSREEEIYSRWLEKGYFRAAVNPNKKPYAIMIPPPNITDKLHVGHALNNTIQDIIIRAKRMQGYETLWLPGTDHAAISTEVQVVKAIAKEGKTKESMGREAFLKRVWQWQEEYGSTIINQLKKLGSSCDWERERFTMDPGLSDAVLEAFVRLYDEGKIYRGERLVNWCVKCQTTISDAEVEHEDGEGQLFHFKYPIGKENPGEFIAFATTRPETMLGDVAIAVHPDDPRYAKLIGQYATMPIVNRKIPIIPDTYVDPEYGTGAVKVTPAHDPNDFEIGQRHNLPVINIMNDDGTINETGGTFSGLSREAARKKIIEEMAALGLYIKTETITHAKGTHDRCNVIVEPLIKLQWFLKMDELAKPALEAYTSGKLKFNRERFGKVYQHWLEIIRDWCISRQIWWGHRIPAYYCGAGHVTIAKAPPTACTTCGDTNLKQDEDTLDTWFSSALWPFSTLGWPEKTPDLEYFYPTNVLVTAPEIIFFWVVRMVFMGYKFTGKAPFSDVVIHGIVRDDQGRKMSKSLGNGIDPLEIVEKYGADVMRLTMVNGNAIENDTRFYWERVEFSRNFMNKLWNASRFVLMNLDAGTGILEPPAAGEAYETTASDKTGNAPTEATTLEDRWIKSRLNALTKDVTEKLDAHELGLAAQKIVDFIWDEFCDWYVEIVKPRLYTGKDGNGSPEDMASRSAALATLRSTLITALKLLHPITPFITEDIFLALQSDEETIMLSQWPAHHSAQADPAAEKAIEAVKEAVRNIRNIRAEKQVPPGQKISVIIQPADTSAEALYTKCKGFIGFLSGASEVEVRQAGSETHSPESGQGPHRDKSGGAVKDVISSVLSNATLYIPLEIDTEKERARLTKEKQKLHQELARIDGKLNNQGFVSKAPASLIAEEREKQVKFAAMLTKVEAELAAL
ncbi:MAG: valine--tRNA ligase [Defluviitaleaceae bacterium]|nr:valine--tRNA ligase [Defluviitaleaceae bacterium]